MDLLEYVCETYGYNEFVANGLIMAGKVLVNDEVCSWIKYKIKKNDRVRVKEKKKKFVTRSGYKLEKAIQSFRLDMDGRTALDIGASEGGFTDCMLRQGIRKVYAVDVAYGILNYALRQNDRVVALERKNARYLTKEDIPETVDYITADVSFISLGKIIPSSLEFLKEDGCAVLLFKPQFELKQEDLGKNGIPRCDDDVIRAMDAFVKYMGGQGLFICDVAKSPIKGNSGNTEYLLLGKKRPCDTISYPRIEECVKGTQG